MLACGAVAAASRGYAMKCLLPCPIVLLCAGGEDGAEAANHWLGGN